MGFYWGLRFHWGSTGNLDATGAVRWVGGGWVAPWDPGLRSATKVPRAFGHCPSGGCVALRSDHLNVVMAR